MSTTPLPAEMRTKPHPRVETREGGVGYPDPPATLKDKPPAKAAGKKKSR